MSPKIQKIYKKEASGTTKRTHTNTIYSLSYMNKLSKEAKTIYWACKKAIQLGKEGKPLEEGHPIDPTRIAIVVLRNIKTVSERKNNDTLAQYYYLGLANQYLEEKEGMSPKETRELSNQSRTEYSIGRFMVETFADPGHVAYLQNISPTLLGQLTVQESRYITFRLTKDFPRKKKPNTTQKRKVSDQEEAPRKELKVNTPEGTPEPLPNDHLEPLEPHYLDLDFLEELIKSED
jgi:hypothetical protein